MPPEVVKLTPLNIVLEFQSANGSAAQIKVEYAKETITSVLDFVSGSHVTVTGGQSTYRVSQKDLIPGVTYYIRVVPLVQIYLKGRNWLY